MPTRPADVPAEPVVAEPKPAEDGVVATEGVTEGKRTFSIEGQVGYKSLEVYALRPNYKRLYGTALYTPSYPTESFVSDVLCHTSGARRV